MSGTFVTCAKESEEASINAVLGYDTTGVQPAHWRFRFRITNEMPTTSGL